MVNHKKWAGNLIRWAKSSRFAQALYAFFVVIGWKRDRALLVRIFPKNHISPPWSEGDDLSATKGWDEIDITPPKVNYNPNRLPKILFLNSMGGSMSRLSRALMTFEGVRADCYVNAYYPKRNMLHPLETNVNGVLTHSEWREFLIWAIKEYDIIQSTALPLKLETSQCYDWLTDKLSTRHIWRSTGFVHHYLLREDILPQSIYKKDLDTDIGPDISKFHGKTFQVKDNLFQIEDNTVFYSSPEKGAYFEGENKLWLPSIREPELFRPHAKARMRTVEGINVYVPLHKNAIFKGLDVVLEKLEKLQNDGHKFNIITPDNILDFFPDLSVYWDKTKSDVHKGAYPIPHHLMPLIMQNVNLVIDQIVMGSYGNTGIEAMMSGLPVIGQKRYSEIIESPVLDINEDNFEEQFIELLNSPNTWSKIGTMGREWALKHHAPNVVAQRAMGEYVRILESSSSEI